LKLYFLFKNHKEKSSNKLLSQLIKPDMIVVDIGANVGYLSQILAGYTQAKVYAVEPNPELLECLKTVTQNHPQIEILALALSDVSEKKEIDFYYSSLFNIDGRAYRNQYSSKKTRVTSISFDQQFQGKKIDFIKMDVQGYELTILKGMKNFLNKEVILYTEFWPSGIVEAGYRPEDLLSLLEGYGFHILLLAKDGIKKIHSTNWQNFFPKKSYFSDANILCYKASIKEFVELCLSERK
jgi:FkbM family methyltransferase